MDKARQAERSRSLKSNQFLLPSGALITERPILFSTEMIQANLEGRKTQTRREVKGLALDWLGSNGFTPEYVALAENALCPYGKPGDLLWVKETWANLNGDFPKADPFRIFKADLINPNQHGPVTWKPSIHMPKEAARIWVMVEEIRVERLQDISEEDALAEGVMEFEDGTFKNYYTKKGLRAEDGVECLLAKGSFQSLWTSINGMDSWDANPWVWVVRYRILSTHGRPSLEEIEQAYLEISNS